MEYAEERVAEAEAVANENKPEAVATAMENYQENISLATTESEKVEDRAKAETLLSTIADNTSKHQEVLAEVLNKVPDEAKEAIMKAIEVSKHGQEEAMKQVAELKGEVEQLKQEMAELKIKSEAENAKTQTIQIEAERQRLQAEKAKAEAEAIKAETERKILQAEIDKLKAETNTETTKPQTETNKGIYCNGSYWSQCPAGQTFVCPPSGNASCSAPQTSLTPTGKNYYADAVYRVKTLIEISKSFEIWLQDTSDQFRSAALTLAGYSAGGLYGESRDSAIELANANIAVISETVTNNKKWISYWQNMLDILNSHTGEFLSQSSFDLIKIPENLEAEISTVKKSINSNLNLVITALQYH